MPSPREARGSPRAPVEVQVDYETAEQVAAFVSRVRREHGLDRLTDLFGENREREGEGA